MSLKNLFEREKSLVPLLLLKVPFQISLLTATLSKTY